MITPLCDTCFVWPSQPFLRGKASGCKYYVSPTLLLISYVASQCREFTWSYCFLNLGVFAPLWPFHPQHWLLSNLPGVISISEANCIPENINMLQFPFSYLSIFCSWCPSVFYIGSIWCHYSSAIFNYPVTFLCPSPRLSGSEWFSRTQ